MLPLIVRELTSQSTVPVLPMVVDKVAVSPTLTGPKSSDSGLTSISQTAAMPSPASETEITGFAGSSLAMSSVPLSWPAPEGV